MLCDCFAAPVQLFRDNNRSCKAAVRAAGMFFHSYVWLTSVNCFASALRTLRPSFIEVGA